MLRYGKNRKIAAILDAILDFEKPSRGIFGDFLSGILHIFLDLFWKNQLVPKNVHLLAKILGLLFLLPFSILHLPFFIFPSQFLPPFPFFPCLLFPDTSAKISRSEVSGGHSAPLPPPPPRLLRHLKYAGAVKRHNPIIGYKHTTLSQWDDDLFWSKMYVLHNRMTYCLGIHICTNFDLNNNSSSAAGWWW